MKNILVGFLTDINTGGINRYLTNMLRLCKEIAQEEGLPSPHFDFLSSNNSNEASVREYLRQYGSDYYIINRASKPKLQAADVKKILSEHSYDAAYFNISEAYNNVALRVCSEFGVKDIYVHSHSSGNDEPNALKRAANLAAHNLKKKETYKYATRYFSCSDLAGRWMYPQSVINSDRYQVVYNAVDTAKYRFDKSVRARIRSELGLTDKLVLGFTGNFVYQKNIPFLMEAFNEYTKLNPDAVLLMIGDGPDKEAAESYASVNNITDKVRFMGRRSDVHALMQAMDAFVLPSRFEGLPVVGVEAQAAGLPVFVSDTVTRDLDFTGSCTYLPVDKGAKTWAEAINKHFETACKAFSDRLLSEEQLYKVDIRRLKELYKELFF